ncbi:threonine/serine exporter family protein [Collinsella sp. AGMB00827]|uniref:Threonine/serine exporter family protein n=1 Tax=Collinsella ureilytica TaxID=2869515 RepID=A0ABS7MIA2_9ACTN|nr:threonine/serine exporter family protein [Collinsella urealyticum]MBY4797074.1 threonine/serine exporter family protein [Collinsella urealyticum]
MDEDTRQARAAERVTSASQAGQGLRLSGSPNKRGAANDRAASDRHERTQVPSHTEDHTPLAPTALERSAQPPARKKSRRSRLAHPRPRRARKIPRNHMRIPWEEVLDDRDVLAVSASIDDKSSIICRAGLLVLSGGAGGWRVRDCMNEIARVLGVTCRVDVGLTTIECTCFGQDREIFSEGVSLTTAGVNTERLWLMEDLVRRIKAQGREFTVGEFHRLLDDIDQRGHLYNTWQVALASAFACGAFVFLLGGGPIEMACAFAGAGIGNFVRRAMTNRRLTFFAGVGASVAAACLTYLAMLAGISLVIPGAMDHEAGYIGAMLFVIPGFPLITSGLDLAKIDMRSGIERLCHAGSIIVFATLVAWLVASMVSLSPDDFEPLGLSFPVLTTLRVAASFIGVLGFSIMFNSPLKMAIAAGSIGMIANALRLSLVDVVSMPPEAAAFVGALTAGLLASAVGLRYGFPRISITVPSIVIMVPGLYMYRAVFCMGNFQTLPAMEWVLRALMIVLFLPMGLGVARALTDPAWRQSL